MRITKLTPAQETILDQVRDEWLAHGLSTQPANRPEAEAGVREAYRAAGLEPPRFLIWLDSPWAGVIGQAIAPEIIGQVDDQVRDQVDPQVYDQVDGQVDSQVYSQVYGQVDGQVDGQVYDQVYGQVDGQVDGQVGGQVDGQVGGQVDSQVYSQVYDQVRGQVYSQVDGQVDGQRLSSWWQSQMYGQHNAGYYSYYDAMERLGVGGLEPIHGQQKAARNCGWWWCFRGFAVLTERPVLLRRDAQCRLHAEHGPALAYPDGYSIFCWHGTRLPADPDLIRDWSDADVMRERNAEVRRAMVEIVGWPKFITRAGFAQVGGDEPDPGNPGQTLRLFDVPQQIYGVPVRVLVCVNATPERDGSRHTFGLTTPVTCATPLEAAAWTFGVTTHQYSQVARAC